MRTEGDFIKKMSEWAVPVKQEKTTPKKASKPNSQLVNGMDKIAKNASGKPAALPSAFIPFI